MTSDAYEMRPVGERPFACADFGHLRLLAVARTVSRERYEYERGRHDGYHAGYAEALAQTHPGEV